LSPPVMCGPSTMRMPCQRTNLPPGFWRTQQVSPGKLYESGTATISRREPNFAEKRFLFFPKHSLCPRYSAQSAKSLVQTRNG
jgi:hypothetical protein